MSMHLYRAIIVKSHCFCAKKDSKYGSRSRRRRRRRRLDLNDKLKSITTVQLKERN